MLGIVVAVSENNVIGKGNTIPWDCPVDMKRFVSVTKRHPIIMGRRTHQSIGAVLPNRLNIVVTRNPQAVKEGALRAKNLDEAISIAEEKSELMPMVIGGQRLYAEALKRAHILYFTRIHQEIKDGDTFFPKINWGEWECTNTDPRPEAGCTFYTYEVKDPWDIE